MGEVFDCSRRFSLVLDDDPLSFTTLLDMFCFTQLYEIVYAWNESET
jgi:hypothetical protein